MNSVVKPSVKSVVSLTREIGFGAVRSSGAGFAYRVRATVVGGIDPTTGLHSHRAQLDSVLRTEVRDFFEGKCLESLGITSPDDALARVIYERLSQKLPARSLVRVEVLPDRSTHFVFPPDVGY